MCGLFAGVGKLSSNRMIALGSMNEERGTDSVGLAYIQNNEMRIAKIAERPCVGLNITLRKEVTEAAVSGLFIGHTRQATQGMVTSRNAHPFLADGIAFAHNGIIINDADFGKYEVDSESLIHGIKSKDFSKYEGPIALVWIENGKLHAYRCGNPLARGRYKGSTYLASDSDYLHEICCTHVKELSEGMIYTFDSPFGVKTEKVKKNKTYSSTFVGSSIGYQYENIGHGWEDQLAKNGTHSLIPTSAIEKQRNWWKKTKEKDITDEMKEDFRTPSDIAKQVAFEHCSCCGGLNNMEDCDMCQDCTTWLDSQGVDRDIPPSYLTIH